MSLGALAAAIVFFVVNHVITTIVIALSLGENPIKRMPMDLRYHLSTSGVLLALAPVLVIAVDFSALALPLLVLPIAAVHKSAKLAIQREEESSARLLDRPAQPRRCSTAQQAACWPEHRLPARRRRLMIVDLDHFKEINDTLGHHIGDQVIEAAADRLSAALGANAMVCRLGGDEFAVLVPDIESTAVLIVAHIALRTFAAPLTADGVRIDVGASIGVAVAPEHGLDVSTLLRRADVALYTAKEERNAVRLYSLDDDRNTVERLELLGDLRGAIEHGEVVVHYQPKISALTGGVVGVEALARWQHPDRGLIMPDDFINFAEHTGLLSLLTASVLRTALADLRRWRTVEPTLTVAVNVAPAQLNDREFPESVWVALHKAGVPAAALTLEVTENGVMASSGRVRQVLDDLRRMGVQLSIDDFGSGATSLSYLGRLPLNELKIDKAFVIGLADPVNHAIVRSTIELGHNLGMQVVAEGVETVDVWHELQVLGCDVLQGYVIARPLTQHRDDLITVHSTFGSADRLPRSSRPGVRGSYRRHLGPPCYAALIRETHHADGFTRRLARRHRATVWWPPSSARARAHHVVVADCGRACLAGCCDQRGADLAARGTRECAPGQLPDGRLVCLAQPSRQRTPDRRPGWCSERRDHRGERGHLACVAFGASDGRHPSGGRRLQQLRRARASTPGMAR